MNNIIKVYSHVRSGTHFLMSILYENFYKNQQISKELKTVGHWSGQIDAKPGFISTESSNGVVPWAKLFARHNFVPVETDKAIYIYRDGKDVMQSMYNFEKKLRSNFDMDFSTYIRSKLDWYEAPSQEKGPKYTPVEHWYLSTSLWLDSNVYKISYKNLKTNTLEQILQIKEHFNLEIVDEVYLGQKLVGHLPNTGKLDSWKDYFSKEDLDYFYSIVPEDYIGAL